MVNIDDLLPPGVSAELEAIDRAVAAARHQTLAQLLHALYGYGDTLASRRRVHLDDYAGMLVARDALEGVLVRATLPTRRLIEGLVSHSDSLLFLGTIFDEGGLLRAPDDRPGWWWHRVPENYDASGFD